MPDFKEYRLILSTHLLALWKKDGLNIINKISDLNFRSALQESFSEQFQLLSSGKINSPKEAMEQIKEDVAKKLGKDQEDIENTLNELGLSLHLQAAEETHKPFEECNLLPATLIVLLHEKENKNQNDEIPLRQKFYQILLDASIREFMNPVLDKIKTADSKTHFADKIKLAIPNTLSEVFNGLKTLVKGCVQLFKRLFSSNKNKQSDDEKLQMKQDDPAVTILFQQRIQNHWIPGLIQAFDKHKTYQEEFSEFSKKQQESNIAHENAVNTLREAVMERNAKLNETGQMLNPDQTFTIEVPGRDPYLTSCRQLDPEFYKQHEQKDNKSSFENPLCSEQIKTGPQYTTVGAGA